MSAATDDPLSTSHEPRPCVSVIMATYNRGDTILRSVQSVLDQEDASFELIVVDDGSVDDTLERLASVDDARLTVLALAGNRGVSAARNAGLEIARGEFVAFQDSDDIWTPNFLAAHLAAQRAAPDDVLSFAQLEQRYPTGIFYHPPHRLLNSRNFNELIYARSFISTQTFMAPLWLVRDVGGFDAEQRSLVDWELMLRLTHRVRFVVVRGAYAIATLSENSLTRNEAQRLASRARIMSKHAAAFARRPRAAAVHWRALAWLALRYGGPGEALGYARRAVRADPLVVRSWLRFAQALLPSRRPRNDADMPAMKGRP